MKTISLLAIAVSATLLSGPMQGAWTGTVDTPHGAAPLQLTVAPSDSSATFEMTFLDATIRGSATAWKTAADSVSFGIPFNTNMGPGEFRLSGRVTGTTMSGKFVGLMNGEEMSQGNWSLTRRQ